MQHLRDYQDLLDACSLSGCPLCRLAYDALTRYLDSWQYEMFTDVEVREELRQSQGFCYEHTWQLARMGASLQLAQTYQAILSDTVEQLQASASTRNGNLFRRRSPAKRERTMCPACLQQAEVEARLVSTFRRALLDESFYQRFHDSQGLCLHHLSLTIELKQTESTGEWLSRLQQAQINCLQRLDQQLAELIRKHDYRFKDEQKGEEMRSWQRAAGLVAGENFSLR